MKHRAIFFLLIAFCFASCKNTWDSDARDLFYQGCIESAKDSHMDSLAAVSMCNCRLEKAMKKYPNFNDAMEHADDLMKDKELKECK